MKTNTLIAKLLKSPPCDWQGIIEKHALTLPASEAGAIARTMEDAAGRLAYLAEYLAHRSGDANCGGKEDHTTAAKKARRQCVRVNKAMGYTYPDRRAFNL